MMRHIFGAAAIPLPPVNQLQHHVGRERERERGDVEQQPNLMQIHSTPPPPQTPGLPHHYSSFMISNRLGRVIVLSHISSLCKLPSFHFSTSFVEKSIHGNKHSVVFAPRPSQFRFGACFLPLFFPRGLIVFTRHICFIPSNVIFPRYWEHLFAPRPWMEVLEREFIFLNPLLISSLRCSGGAARRASQPRWDCS